MKVKFVKVKGEIDMGKKVKKKAIEHLEGETKGLRKFVMEDNAHEIIEQIIDDKKKTQCWIKIKNRFVDAFTMGAARAIYCNLPRKELTTNSKQKYDVMKIDELTDRDDLFFILRIIGYYDKINNSKSDEDSAKTHEVLFKLSECLTLTEQYFKSSWVEPNPEQNFKNLCIETYPDSLIMKDFM